MNITQETFVTSSQDRFTTVEVPIKDTKTKGDCNGTKATIEELFPWIIEFKKKCRCLLAQPNIVALIKLMKFYARNVSINVNECYTKPYRAAKLKDSISETLLFFLYYFRELVEVCDKNSYLDKMSDLLAMYLDMELKASRRGKEHHSKISARLTSCLYVYLENSSEHILDTFIKARFINRNYHEIIDPVLTKVSKNLPASPSCDTMYVRYLLMYRLWKKVNNDAAVKNQINATAIIHLGPPPLNPTPFLAKYVLPKVPKSQANSTKFLLLHKFDIEKSCRLFIQYCKENREDEDQGDLDKPNFIANAVNSDTLETLRSRGTNHTDNLIDNVNILSEGERRQRISVKTNNYNNPENLQGKCIIQENMKTQKNITKNESNETSALKPLRSGKTLPRFKTKKTGNILFIDLTADEITEKVIKKKKHRKLHWLTEVKKKLNSKATKAAEKKKKAQIIANNSSSDPKLFGLVDSTSAQSLSIVMNVDPTTTLANNLVTLKSLSEANTPEPENCVTSNSTGNDFNEVSNFIGKQLTCDVTTTVNESISSELNKLEEIVSDASNTIPSSAKNIGQYTISQQNKNTLKKSETLVISELSNALSHICESYDSDNSAMNASSNENMDCKQNKNAIVKVVETDIPETESMPNKDEKALKIMELQKHIRKPQNREHGSSLESRDGSFTQCVSNGEIAGLDNYSVNANKIHNTQWRSGITEMNIFSSIDSTTDEKCKRITGVELIQNSRTCEVNNRPKMIINNCDVKDLTLRTDQLKLTNSLGTLSVQKDTGKKKANDDDDQSKEVLQRKNGIRKGNKNNRVNHLKTNILQTNDGHSVKGNKTLIQVKQQIQITNKSETHLSTLEKSEQSKLVDRNIKKRCDYKSSRRDDAEISKKQDRCSADEQARTKIFENKSSSISKEYIEKQRPIPKMNEILICTKNDENDIRDLPKDLLTNQEPQFNDNIDGLSLLASVSQHVSHLEEYSEKSLCKPKIINGKAVPQPNSEAKNYVIKEIGDASSDELFLDLKINNRNKMIKEIVAFPEQINDNKLINEAKLNLENCESFSSNAIENDSTDVVPLILETTVDLNSSTLHNNLISVENVTQMIKESTKVIVNGETVVLFQKSPNSNLYIINKTADGTMECLADDKTKMAKNNERNSTAMRDIINHIPINSTENNIECQDGMKMQKIKTFESSNKTRIMDCSKIDNSANKYENQLLISSTYFQPIHEKITQHGDIRFENEHIKKEVLNSDSYEDNSMQRCTDTPGSVIGLEQVTKSPPPIIRLSDTPIDLQMIANHEEIYEESIAINMATTGRLIGRRKGEGGLNENLTCTQNIKQEFQNCNDLSNVVNSDAQQVTKQKYSNINNPNTLFSVNSILSSNKIPHIYSTVTTATNFYNLESERCDYPSCSLNKVNPSQSYQSITQSPISNCQLLHCACMKCAYEVHHRQYVQQGAATAVHPSYLQTNSYILSADNSADQEIDLKLNETVLAKLNDDELLHNIEQSIIDNNKQLNNQTNVKTLPEMKYKPEFENKLPLKKRLKAHAMLSMSSEGLAIKIEKAENYPGTPMMSIAALETGNVQQNNLYEDKLTPVSTALELKDYSLSSHHTTEMIRRDYLKDTSLTSIGNCANVDDRVKKLEQQRRQANSHVNIMGTGCQRSFQTPAQRKECTVSLPLSLKRAATTVANHPKSPKKGKKGKMMGNYRQTRSSKRNIPKVDYSYDGIIDGDPKYNALNEMRRKRKKTNR